jgi:hypothetical protein
MSLKSYSYFQIMDGVQQTNSTKCNTPIKIGHSLYSLTGIHRMGKLSEYNGRM